MPGLLLMLCAEEAGLKNDEHFFSWIEGKEGNGRKSTIKNLENNLSKSVPGRDITIVVARCLLHAAQNARKLHSGAPREGRRRLKNAIYARKYARKPSIKVRVNASRSSKRRVSGSEPSYFLFQRADLLQKIKPLLVHTHE